MSYIICKTLRSAQKKSSAYYKSMSKHNRRLISSVENFQDENAVQDQNTIS